MEQIAVQARERFSVLIIEDDTSVRQLIRICLEEVGYSVKEAPNGRKGLHSFRQAPVDLVITDIFMPDRDGIEVIECLHRKRPDIKILAISAASGTMDCLQAATAAGAACILRKPFAICTMLNTVATLLGDSISKPPENQIA